MSRKTIAFRRVRVDCGRGGFVCDFKVRDSGRHGRPAFVYTNGAGFMIRRQAVRFVGANAR